MSWWVAWSRMEYSDSSALGESDSSPGVACFQTCLKTTLATTAPNRLLISPKGR